MKLGEMFADGIRQACMNENVHRFCNEHQVPIFIRAAIFQWNLVVAADIVGHELHTRYSAAPILRGKQRNAVVGKLDAFVQYRDAHQPQHGVCVDAKAFVNLGAALRCVAVDAFLFVQCVLGFDISHRHNWVPIEKS